MPATPEQKRSPPGRVASWAFSAKGTSSRRLCGTPCGSSRSSCASLIGVQPCWRRWETHCHEDLSETNRYQSERRTVFGSTAVSAGEQIQPPSHRKASWEDRWVFPHHHCRSFPEYPCRWPQSRHRLIGPRNWTLRHSLVDCTSFSQRLVEE